MNQKNLGRSPLLFSRQVTFASKGAAVILMMMHHLFYCCPELAVQYQVRSSVLSWEQIYIVSETAKICVAVFVILTAYGMTAARADKKPDIGRRLRRLLLSFWVVYAVSVLTFFLRNDRMGIYFNAGRLTGLCFAFLDACGLANLVGTPMYNETWWYMSLAILLVFLIPVLIALYRKFGVCVLGICFFLPYLIEVQTGSVYLLPAMLGVWAAQSRFFERLKKWTEKRTILLPLLAAVLLFFGACFMRKKIGMIFWIDGIAAFLMITVWFLLIDCASLKLRILTLLGKHSMNIFLVHTLLFEYYFPKWIYAPGNWLLITLLLLICSLAVSVILTPIQNALQKAADRLAEKAASTV